MRAAWLTLLCACAAVDDRVSNDGPVATNVVVILTDDQGFGDFSYQGSTELATPHLDRLAAESAQMETFYVSPVCAPTRAALMTGRWPQRARVIDTWIGRAMLPPEEVTIAEALAGAGFATGIFGKWHLGDCFPMRPRDQGFDEALIHRGGGIGQPADPEGGEGKYTDPVLFHNGARVEPRGFCTDIYFDAAIDWIGEQHAAGERFFAYVPTNAPHGPFHDVPEELYRRHVDRGVDDRHARIYAMIENIDQNVGRMQAALEELGIADETLVIFLLDNGPNSRRFVGDMRGMKSEVYEGGVRSPLLARWPRGFPAGLTAPEIAAHVDLAPTILSACGVAPAPEVERGFDGRDLAPLLRGEAVAWPDRALVIQAHRGDHPVRWHNAMVRTQRWKLVNASGFHQERESVEPAFELYEIPIDPREEHDLSAERPDIVRSLVAEYDAWFADVGAHDAERYAPSPIVVGDPRSTEVHLTRQDWRRMDDDGWGSRGTWHLDVAGPGPYTARVRFVKGDEPTEVTMSYRGTVWRQSVPEGARDVTLEGILLAPGRGGLVVDLATPKGTTGAYQVILR